ncbi:MAG: adenylosuccinate lyase [Candidatus Pacebacteria bacterium]|nr:adenylosuccinate lyase [Candidatus Paceibacterota bacterium]
MNSATLKALSPLDGRYQKYGAALAPHFSEEALMYHRVTVMVAWLRFLANDQRFPVRSLTAHEMESLDDLVRQFKMGKGAISIKAIETTGWRGHPRTNHDVKACEIYIRQHLLDIGAADLVEWVHFGRTSEDVNNVAYGLMLAGALSEVVLPSLERIRSVLEVYAQRYAALPMLSRTHGQPATPTTLGKEFLVFERRLARQMADLRSQPILIKMNGASGNYAADYVVFPGIDWQDVSLAFCAQVASSAAWRFETNLITTQIEPHDTYAELFAPIMRANTILIDMCQDLWRYISDDWIVQRMEKDETGSSTMPHKVNPINFENGEGNLGLANALFEFFSRKLPISRLQRDLSDSTVERNFGVAFGYALVAYENIVTGLSKIMAHEQLMRTVLRNHPEVITEAYQMILRSVGYPDPYGVLKRVSRGAKMTLEDLHAFVHSLDSTLVSDEVKARMLAITPENYVGIAQQLVR